MNSELLIDWTEVINNEDSDENAAQTTSNQTTGDEIRRGVKGKLKSDSRESSTSCKRVKHNSNSDSESSRPPRKKRQLESDVSILQRRQKQIDYGKNTVGYNNYTQQVPVDKRTKDHPRTPDKYTQYSRRSWDALIKLWRKRLHEFDSSLSDDISSIAVEYCSDTNSNN